MHRIRLDMEMSSMEHIHAASTGVSTLLDVRLLHRPVLGPTRVEVIIATDDPDDVEIAREIVWQFDAGAVQHALTLFEAVPSLPEAV